ncbi:MAG: glycosyltransferase [Actinomycetia bacterium]|nr:glycosyltransferase [Actinomycetes bacterium]
MRDGVAAAVVSYEPTTALVHLVTTLRHAGLPVHVVDNASTTATGILRHCQSLGAEVTWLDHNTGVAGALQVALEQTDAEWLFTFDQDSRVTPELIDRLLVTAARRVSRVAVVAPVVRDQRTGNLLQGDPGRSAWYVVRRTVTSGSLCRVEALRQVGGFRTDLVIDFVDWELCLRLRAAGWEMVIEPQAELLHTLGAATRHQLPLIGEVTTTNHSADRLYYRYRNALLVARAGGLGMEARWAARTALGLVLGVGKVVALEHDRASKLRAIGAGLRDGVRGRAGTRRLPAPVPMHRTPVSVCMATYNGSQFLTTQLTSILDQLGPDDEVLVQDDASTDDTLDVIEALDDPRIQVQRNPFNQGLITTFERCLARATKPVVFLADQDDQWLPGKVDAVLDEMASPGVTAVVTNAEITDADLNPTGELYFEHARSGPGVVHNFIKNSYLGCCLAVRREVLEVALPVPRSVRTHDGWIGITADLMGEVVFLPTPYLRYRRHRGNASQMTRFGLADIAKRRAFLAAHLARITPEVLRRRRTS